MEIVIGEFPTSRSEIGHPFWRLGRSVAHSVSVGGTHEVTRDMRARCPIPKVPHGTHSNILKVFLFLHFPVCKGRGRVCCEA